MGNQFVRPLSKDELYEALAVKPCRTGLNKSQRLLRNVSLSTECADLISEVNNSYQLRHASLKDFLLSELPTLVQHGALQRQAHVSLAETCLRYLNFQYFSSVNVGSSEELSELKSGYPLLEYAATYWGRHFSEGQGSQSKPLGYLLAEFLESQLSIRVSLQVMGVESTFNHQKGQPGAPTPLHMLSILNLFDVADSMPKVKSLLESRDDLARTPIEYSVLYERREMTRWLLDRYLDHHRNGVGFDQGILRSGLLHKAAGHDWIEIIDGLLEMGFDKNELDAEDKTPLHLSAEKGANGVMRRLLELGASTELKDRRTSNASHGANHHFAVPAPDSPPSPPSSVKLQSLGTQSLLHEAVEAASEPLYPLRLPQVRLHLSTHGDRSCRELIRP
ncbi:hypothetical protein CMUS01_16594 [Colletotrichum musicola]|uniref:Ankyrin repeat protein n=1 Tax=Colletotrichum musicola TaxID=2175873 RepID=A0A8H6ILT4_9PEZI|nr:hypothetical protein CMUS01_16594 [Colletotrichum musicola]